MDLRRLHCGKNELSVDALKAALLQLESGLSSRQVSVRSIRLGEVLCYEPQRDRAGDVNDNGVGVTALLLNFHCFQEWPRCL